MRTEFVGKKGDELFGFGTFGPEFDARVHVFGVFTKDDHVHFFWMLDGRFDPLVMPNGANAGIEIQRLTQGHVETAKAGADRRSQRALDGEFRCAQGREGGFGQKLATLGKGLAASQKFLPVKTATVGVAETHRRINNRAGTFPDIRADAVPFDPIDGFEHEIPQKMALERIFTKKTGRT